MAAQGGCSGLEHGLAWAEAARCSVVSGQWAQAQQRFSAALAAWEAGQVDGLALREPVQAELALLQASVSGAHGIAT